MNDVPVQPSPVDVLIVGSGPIGAAFARVIYERAPQAKILMVDLGPPLTPRPGVHARNITDPQERAQAQIRSQGPTQYQYEIPALAERYAATTLSGRQRVDWLSRPGTHLINTAEADLDKSDMPAASASSNVGGMGVHWSCACPRPGNTERVPFIPEDEWDRLCREAERLLCVTQQAFPASVEAFAILQTLRELFDDRDPAAPRVQEMPLAVQVDAHGRRYWTGPEVVLGPLADAANGSANFALRAETICRQVLTAGDQVTGVLLEHLPTGTRAIVAAKVVVVAADSLRTPQLLWASGIRPRALGHYLNDQPQVGGAIELKEAVIERARAILQASGNLASSRRSAADTTLGAFWVPFHDPERPFQGSVIHWDVAPIPLDVGELQGDPQHLLGVGWFLRKEVRYEDYIEFSEQETDYHGMPKMTIHHQLTARDKAEMAAAWQEQLRLVAAFGQPLPDEEPRIVPSGSSLHYQGSVRMGARDDSESVCDPYARVWGWPNLFVGGNGVIPTSTACNPTLTSVALAVRAAEHIAASLSGLSD